MTFLLGAMLLSQGVNIIGSLNSAKQSGLQGRIQKAAAEVNAETQRTAVMEKYTDIFSQQVSEIASQTAAFANAGVDKASSIFRQGIAKHERNFLDTKADQTSDMRNIYLNLSSQKNNIDLQTHAAKSKAYQNVASGLMSMATTYIGYNNQVSAQANAISGGQTASTAGQSLSMIGDKAINTNLTLNGYQGIWKPRYSGMGW